MPRRAPALPTVTGSPAATRSRHCCATQQPSVSPEKDGAPQPNSTSGGRRKVPSRGRLARSPGKGGDLREARVFDDSLRHISPGNVFRVPVFGVSICKEGVFWGDGTLSSPPRFFLRIPGDFFQYLVRTYKIQQ